MTLEQEQGRYTSHMTLKQAQGRYIDFRIGARQKVLDRCPHLWNRLQRSQAFWTLLQKAGNKCLAKRNKSQSIRCTFWTL